MKKIIIGILAFCFVFNSSMAQNTAIVEMADGMRASGKIYVVVAVLAIIFIGLLVFLFNIDRRLKKIENSK